MKEKLLAWPVNSPWWFILFSLCLVMLASFGNKDLYFNADYKIFFDDGDPQLLAHEKIEGQFLKSDSLGILVAPENKNIFTKDNLLLIREITERAWLTQYVSRVDSITNYQLTSGEGDDLIVEDLAPDYLPLDKKRIAYIREQALSEPRINGSLVSNEGEVAIINITFNTPEGYPTKMVTDTAKLYRDLFEEMGKKYPGVEFHMVGIVALNIAFTEAAISDASSLNPLMFAAIVVFLALMLKSWRFVLMTLVVITTSIASTMGLLGWLGHYLSTATVNVPTVVMTLAVADCVHVIVSYIGARQEGEGHKQAIISSVSLNLMALLITSVTTAVGFLMLNASESPVLREFGSLTSVGIIIAFILSVTLLPALMFLLPERDEKFSQYNYSQSMTGLADWVIKYKVWILPFGIMSILVSTWLMFQNKIEDKQFEYFSHEYDFRQAVDLAEEKLSGSTLVNISVNSGKENGITDPEFLETVARFTAWLNEQPEVGHVSSITDTFKRLNKNMHNDDDSYYRLPEQKDLASQYLLLYEMSLPYGRDLNNEINIDKSAVKLSVTVKNVSNVELIAFENRVYQWLEDNSPSSSVLASSISLMFAHVGEVNLSSMVKTLPVTLVVISGLLIFALRSLRLGVMSLVPNIAPAILGFGLWALVSGEINLGLSVVVSMTLGIVVDDAVHFLTKYRYARIQGRDVEDGVRYAFNTVGRALWITTVVLVVGFGILATSDFRVNSDMGLLSAIVIFIALVVDFTILPAALLIFDRKSYVASFQMEQQNISH
ncbi:efflux RND transporter permease subunit [Veronia pacifica]|uniref:RND transporter n=1 Tax=Veronia pacifica TaxID=1080227 RepID=A0A1C3ERS5_9GAMM|nr:MMPL family transporter [Veronia pacifica]ODA35943.1 RND transporter [Veronia pacifica]